MTYLDETAAAIKAGLSEDLIPDEQGLDDLFRLYALLAHVKGENVTAKPFAALDPSTRREDLPFVEAIRKGQVPIRGVGRRRTERRSSGHRGAHDRRTC